MSSANVLSIIPYGFASTLLISFGLYIFIQTSLALFNYTWRVRQIRKLPGLPGHWLLGGLAEFPGPGEVGLNFMRERNPEYPKMAYMYFGPFQIHVAVNHPETAKHILKTSEPKPLGSGAYFNALPWLGEGLLIGRGKRWARNRRLLTPAFHFDILKPYATVNNKASDILIEKLSTFANEDQYFEVFNHISLCTLDVILKCAFSYDEDIQRIGKDHPYVAAMQQLTHTLVYRLLRPWLYPNLAFYLSPTGRQFRKNCQLAHSVSNDVIQRRKKTLKDIGVKNGKYLDFLDILLTARDDSGTGLTDREIRDEVDTFLFEGHDTTASGISWALYNLASNPEWQRKCQAEVDSILEGRDSDDILWNDLPKLKTLTLCIKEALRLNTTVPFIQRETTKDMYIDGYFIPAGTQVDIQLYMIMHNTYVWEDPMMFKPERFLSENAEKLDSYANIPFSAGPRNCIGQNFAMHEMKSIIARVLRKFDLEIDPERRAKPEIRTVMKTEDGMYLKATHRREE